MSEETLPTTPYKGLIPYSEEDAPFFFGREREREIITANLMASRLTLLYGASGVGKSSVLRAGVVYPLRQLAWHNLSEHGTPEFVVSVFNSWRDDPLMGLVDCVRQAVAQAIGGRAPVPMPTTHSLPQTLQIWTESVGGNLLVILDQFEEYFLYHAQEDGEGTFAVEFPRAVNRPELRVNFLVSVREDALAKLDRFKGRIPNLFDNYLRIEHLSRNAAREAIEKPLAQYNLLNGEEGQKVSIEPALVDEVLRQVEAGQVLLGEVGRGVFQGAATPSHMEARIETPYLQLVMTRLWKENMEAHSPVIRLETLNRLGGAERIIQTHLDDVMGALPSSEQNVASRVFHYLVTPSGTKIAYPVLDLAGYAGLEEGELNSVLRKLSDGEVRILRPVGPESGQPAEQRYERYEIFHDVLAPAILAWRTRYVQSQERVEAEKRAAIEAAERARETAQQREVEQAQALAEEQKRRAEAERQRAEEQQRRVEAERQRAAVQAEAARRRGRLVVALAVVSVFAVAAAVWAYIERQQAKADERIAFSHELAAKAFNSLAIDPELSVLLGLQAVSDIYSANHPVPGEVHNALHRAVQELRARFMPSLIVSGHTGVVHDMAFSRDGQYLATASEDNTARVWEMTTGREVISMMHASPVKRIIIHPDGRSLATVSQDGGVKVWDAVSGQEQSLFTEPLTAVNSIAFSPDGRRLATAGQDKEVRVWDAVSGQEQFSLPRDDAVVMDVAFSPDGRRLAIASRDAKVWDFASDQNPVTLPDPNPAAVIGVAFSPDGSLLATASGDTTRAWNVTVWNVTSRQIEFSMSHGSAVKRIIFLDKRRLVVVSEDGTVKMRDATSGKELPTVFRDATKVNNIAFSPAKRRLATTSSNGEVKVWDTAFGYTSVGIDFAFTPDGRRLATASRDGTVKVWDAISSQELLTLSKDVTAEQSRGFDTMRVNSVAFSPDGRRLAAASPDKTIKVWDSASGRELRSLPMHSVPRATITVSSVAFSPDGRLLAASIDRTVKVWDSESGDELFALPGDTTPVSRVIFHPDGRRLVTVNRIGTVKVWDAASGKELPALFRDTMRIDSLAFSPAGERLATVGRDGVVKVWDATSAKEPHILTGHTTAIIDIAFSPAGERLAAVGRDGTVKVWDAAAGKEHLTLTSDGSAVNGVAFSPDGRLLATVSQDGMLRVYALNIQDLQDLKDLMMLARAQVSRPLRHDECERDLRAKQCPSEVTALEEVVKGKDLARAGKVDAAVERFREAHRLNPALRLDPEMEASQLAAETLLAEGRSHARAGHLDAAVARFRKAQNLSRSLHLDPQAVAGQLAAEALLVEGRHRARAGDVEGAVTKFESARQLDSTLRLNPESEARRLVAIRWLTEGERLIRQDPDKQDQDKSVEAAVAAYEEAERHDPMQISAESWNTLCWLGSLKSHAKDVLKACDKAVNDEPDNRHFRDSRGVALAMIGKSKEDKESIEGAIKHFQEYIDKTYDKERKEQRRRWIVALSAGQNPFTPEEIKTLLNQ